MTTPADTTTPAPQPEGGTPTLGKGVKHWNDYSSPPTVVYQRVGDDIYTYSYNPDTDEVKISTDGTGGPFTPVNEEGPKGKIKEQYEESKRAMDEANPEPPTVAKELATEQVAKDNQCMLISNIAKIKSKSTPPKGASFYEEGDFPTRESIKYKNIHKIRTKDPATIMNKLRMTRGSENFLNITPHEYSQLTPTIRLFKEYYEEKGGDPIEVEFKFANFVDPVDDLQAMLDSSLQRGVGVGVESFSYRFRGVQPETAKKDIEAELTIYAQNFNELFKDRFGIDSKGKTRSYRIIDLLFLEPKYRFLEEGDNRKQREFNPNFYETKAIVGWASTGGGGIISSDLSSAIRENQIALYLIVTNHDFSFDPEGGVRLKINFTARVESMMLDSRSDILADPATKAARKERREKVNELISKASKAKKDDKEACLDEKIKELKEAYNLNVEKERENSYLSLLRELMKQNAIYTAGITRIEPEEPASAGSPLVGDAGEVEIEIIKSVCSDEDAVDASSPLLGSFSDLMSKGVRYVNYFFLGDLLALAINNVLGTGPKKSSVSLINYGKVKFMLGPAVIGVHSPQEDDDFLINLADIPVSVDLFTHFMQDKIINKRRNSYPLLNFIRDLTKYLIDEALSPNCIGDNKTRIMLDTAQISADSDSGGSDPITKHIEGAVLDVDKFPSKDGDNLFPSFNRKGLNDNYNYFVIYAFDRAARSLAFDQKDAKSNESAAQSRYDRDLSRGIHHLSVGNDRGLVKTMSFKATTQKFLKEARYLESDFNPELQLTNVYDVSVDLLGNNLFYPGQRVYINPRGLGSDKLGDPSKIGDPANIIGLGGYHVIKFVSSTIRPDGFSTNLTCLFETSGDGIDSSYDNKDIAGGEPGSVITNCTSLEDEIKQLTSKIRGAN